MSRQPGDHLRIYHIVLGQPPGRAGEAAHPLRSTIRTSMPALRKLWPSPARSRHSPPSLPCQPSPAKPRRQLTSSFQRAWQHSSARQRANLCVHLVLRHIDTHDNAIVLCHHPAPFLARYGLKALATVRVEEDTDLSHAPRQALRPSSTIRLRSATGGWSERPFAHSGKFCGHKSTKYAVKPLRRGCRCVHRSPVCSCAPFFAHFGTRDRGCSAHPAFPAPLFQ